MRPPLLASPLASSSSVCLCTPGTVLALPSLWGNLRPTPSFFPCINAWININVHTTLDSRHLGH